MHVTLDNVTLKFLRQDEDNYLKLEVAFIEVLRVFPYG